LAPPVLWDCTSARREIPACQQGTVEKGVIELPEVGTPVEAAETASANSDVKQLPFLMFWKARADYPQIYPQISSSIASQVRF
jgi:hypothetical protein